jgi:hypothetical protein
MNEKWSWAFALAPQTMCLAFLKKLISGFWGKLWTSITTHGF